MSDENKTQNSNQKSSGAKGGFKGGRKFGSRDGKPAGKGNGRSGGFKGGKPAWKKDGERKGGKPAWKRDGEGKGESKDGKRFGDKPAWKKDGDARFDRGDSKRRDDRKGGKRFERDDRKGGFRKDEGRDKKEFKPKREYTKIDESSFEKPNFKKLGSKPAPKKDFRSDDRPREKRGDRYLRDNARLKSKKERDAMELSREDDFIYAGDRVMPRKALEGIFVEIGETVSHADYGQGVVRKVTGGKVGVEFDGKYRWFAFPSSIEKGTLVQGAMEDQAAEAEEVVKTEEVEAAEPIRESAIQLDADAMEDIQSIQMDLDQALDALSEAFGADVEADSEEGDEE